MSARAPAIESGRHCPKQIFMTLPINRAAQHHDTIFKTVLLNIAPFFEPSFNLLSSAHLRI